MKKKLISYDKKTKILTHNLVQKSIQGKYFNLKKDLTNFDISFIRNSIEIEGYKKFINIAKQLPHKFILLGRDLVEVKDFEKGTLVFKDFESEFFWAKCIIQENSEKINRFLNFKEQYSLRFLYGEIEEAKKILDSIEAEFGQSLWLIKNKLSFYQETIGLEKNKSYTNSLKKHLKNGSLAKYIIHWLSIRNENNVSIHKFNSQIESTISKLNKDDFKNFIIYHLFERENLNPEELIQVLRLSYSFSIIDYYESFVSLLKSIMLNSFDDSDGAKVKNFLESHHQIDDSRLNNIALMYNIKDKSVYNVESVEVYDSLLLGKVNKKNIDNLNYKKNISISIILYCYENYFINKKDLEFNQDNLLGKILFYLNKIISKGVNGCQNEYLQLQKIIVNNSCLYWINSIKFILNKEISSPKNKIIDLDFDIFNFEYLHPLTSEFINNQSVLKKILDENLEEYGKKISLSYHTNLNEGKVIEIDHLSPQNQYYLYSLNSFKNESYQDAIKYAEELKNLNMPFFTRKANSIISYSLLKLEKYDILCEFIVKVYLNDKNQFSFLPLEELVKILVPNSKAWKICEALIDLSIVLDICLKHLSKDINLNKLLTIHRRYAYEDYLRNKSKERPSELVFNSENKDKLIYFFTNICQENIMDLSGAFEGGSNEVLEERLKICRLLLDNDSNNRDTYKNEINEIVRRQVISSRRKEVDQSRVYVDIKGIKDWAERELNESFLRYKSYINAGLNKPNSSRSLKVASNSIIYTPENEANDLFLSMIEEIRSIYLSSDIGLDRFISTRIRHGELERTIRIPIQKHNLITKKEQKDGPYLSNDYWLNKLQNAGTDLIKTDALFKEFSENFDNLISEIAKEWLQIESVDKPKGLFDFKLQVTDVERLRNLINKDSSLKSFVDLIISVLENKLIIVLLNIQEQINTNGKDRAKALLLKLNDDINELSEAPNVEIGRAINQARIDLALQFDKIIHWFNPSNESNSAPYTIEDAVFVAEAIIKEGDSNFSISLTQNDKENYPIHGQLPSLVDILLNVFDNVVKRSGLDNPSIKIQIDKEKIDETFYRIIMNFSNNLGDGVYIDKAISTLDKIKDKMKKNSYIKDVAKEHNSGLIKIYKTICDFSICELNYNATMDFRIIDNKFELNISIPFQLFSFELEEQTLKN